MKAINPRQTLVRLKHEARVMQVMWFLVLAWWGALFAQAQPSSGGPPKPTRYFNDYAQVVSSQAAERLNQVLENFEKTDSSQLLVVVYPRLPPGAALEDYTIRAASAWKAGQKGKDNGAILFVFVQDRKMRIEVGYGLEGAIPDAIAKRIIDEQIKPHFQRGDYDSGLSAGVMAMAQAARGEYKGTGQTVASRKGKEKGLSPLLFFLVIILIFAFSFRRRRGTVFSPSGRGAYWGGWGGGGWGGGGGGGGGFSGGGGRFGGGGASGGW